MKKRRKRTLDGKSILDKEIKKWVSIYDDPKAVTTELMGLVSILNTQLDDSYDYTPPHLKLLALFVKNIAILLALEFEHRGEEKACCVK